VIVPRALIKVRTPSSFSRSLFGAAETVSEEAADLLNGKMLPKTAPAAGRIVKFLIRFLRFI
jgi:hypothetical protein